MTIERLTPIPQESLPLNELQRDYVEPLQVAISEFEQLDESTYSLLVFGSVARGSAVTGTSDLDLLLIHDQSLSKKDVEEMTHKTSQLLTSRFTFLPNVSWRLQTFEDLDSANYNIDLYKYYDLLFLVRHLSTFLSGKELPYIELFKPSPELAYAFVGDIEAYISEQIEKLDKVQDEGEIREIGKSIGKKLIRSTFSIVMAEHNKSSSELSEQKELSDVYYPDNAQLRDEIFKNVLSPTSDKSKIKTFLNSYGSWLIEEYNQKVVSKIPRN